MIMSGNPAVTIKSSMTDKFQADDHNEIESQAVVYSNSKTNVDESLLDVSTRLLEKMHKPKLNTAFADSSNGGDEIKSKTCTMAAVTNYTKIYIIDMEIVL